MPSLISPEFAGTLSADAHQNLENELRGEAAKLSHDLQVGNAGVGNSRAKGPEQRAFDAQLALGLDPFAEAFATATADHVAYFLKMGVPMDKINRALRGSGIAIPAAPIDPAIAAVHHEAMIAQPDAKPSDYAFDIGRLSIDLPAERQAVVHSTLAQWSVDLHLDPIVAKGLGEFIAEEGPRLAKLTEPERQQWLGQQNSILLKGVGGNKAMAVDMIAKAHKVLAMSGAINGTERFSDAIKAGPIGQSAWLLRTLANHADALDATERAKKKL